MLPRFFLNAVPPRKQAGGPKWMGECPPLLQAGEKNQHRFTCNNRILDGACAVSITGIRPAPVILPAFQGVPVGTIKQVIGVFILVFDGDGEVTLTNHVTVKGSLSGLFPVFPENPTSGTYTVRRRRIPYHRVAPQQVMVSGIGKKVKQDDSSRPSR